MIVTLENDDGFIYAYASFVIVDEHTKLDDNGKYFFINGVWIHPDYRNNGCLNRLVAMMFKKSNSTEFVYWSRESTGKDSGILPISKFLDKIKRGNDNE